MPRTRSHAWLENTVMGSAPLLRSSCVSPIATMAPLCKWRDNAVLACALLLCSSCISPVATMAPLFEQPAPAPNRIEDVFVPGAGLAVSYIGHATVLLQIGDQFVLTDPVLTRTVGQISARLVEPGLTAERMPRLTAVVISHTHFDHLSLGTLEQIEGRVGALLLPRPGLNYLTDFGFPAVELDPWQAWQSAALRITAVPVHHSGARYAFDTWMQTARTGYLVEREGIRVYFAGDTAYDPAIFAATRQRYPDIDLALLPIGPIEPSGFMRAKHLDPEQALQAMLDLGARRMLAIHFDTFVNGNDRVGEAPRRLRAAAQRHGLSEDRVLILHAGEQRVILRR